MRKFFAVFTVFLLVALMVVPAFAVGSTSGYSTTYSALPFQYMYWKNMGGPIEYPFAATRRNSVVDYSYSFSNTPDSFLDVHVSSSTTYLDGTFTFQETETLITLELKDSIVNVDKTNGILFHAFPDFNNAWWSVRIYGSYTSGYKVVDDLLVPINVSFDKKFMISDWDFRPHNLLTDLFTDPKYIDTFDFNSQLFDSLYFDILLHIDRDDSQLSRFEVFTPASALSPITPSVSLWTSSKIAEQGLLGSGDSSSVPPIDISSFNLGVWLRDSVTAFVDFELFPGFSISKLFVIVLTIGVALWFFKNVH